MTLRRKKEAHYNRSRLNPTQTGPPIEALHIAVVRSPGFDKPTSADAPHRPPSRYILESRMAPCQAGLLEPVHENPIAQFGLRQPLRYL
jgi:hypothetical protein